MLISGVRFERFRTKIWKKKGSAVRLWEVSAFERVQLQRYKCNSAGAKFAVRFRECPLRESWLYIFSHCIYIFFSWPFLSFTDQCKVINMMSPFFKECMAYYDWDLEDQASYHPKWVPMASNETIDEKKEATPWQYQSAWKLKGTPYWGRLASYWGGGIAFSLVCLLFWQQQVSCGGNLDKFRSLHNVLNPFTPKLKKYVLRTFQSEMYTWGSEN